MADRKFLKRTLLMLAAACALSVGAGASCTYVNATQCAVCHYTLIIAGSESCCYSYSCNNAPTNTNCGACGYAKMRNLWDRLPASNNTARADARSEEAIVLSQLLMRDKHLMKAVNQLAMGSH